MLHSTGKGIKSTVQHQGSNKHKTNKKLFKRVRIFFNKVIIVGLFYLRTFFLCKSVDELVNCL